MNDLFSFIYFFFKLDAFLLKRITMDLNSRQDENYDVWKKFFKQNMLKKFKSEKKFM